MTNKTLQQGPVKVIVNAKPDRQTEYKNDIEYQLYYNDRLYWKAKDSTESVMARVFLLDLDNDGAAEVIVSTFSGGAHCCTTFDIYSWRKDKFRKTKLEGMDGMGGGFNDLDGDGDYEFILGDRRFLYQFTSYAGSATPSRIYDFVDGKLKENTRKYPKFLRENLNYLYESFLEDKKSRSPVNGKLAAYVAQKILLAEYEDGWRFMLNNYDRKSHWGLDIYRVDQVVGKYPNFPTALRAFLVRTGYLTPDGKPAK